MKIKRILGGIILGVYVASNLLSALGYITWDTAEASTSGSQTSPLVAILIDNETYNSISSNSNFNWYTDSYIQEKYPDSETVILTLDTKEYTAPEIVKLLENIYFDGKQDSASRLIGVIIMGKIPLPVANYQNYIFPTVYPYTDFIEQKYIWDEQKGYFVLNKANGQAEIRHGLISLDDTSKYDDFFKKLKKYNDDPEKFVQKKIWYDDFIALNKNFLNEVYQLYKNKMIFAEDLMYHRYTNFLVDLLQTDQEGSNAEILGDLADSMSEIGVNIPEVQSAKEELLNNEKEFVPTLLLQNKIGQFIKNYQESLSTTLLKAMDDNIKASDRRKTIESHYQKIELKDQIALGNDDTNGIFKSINDKLEEYVDQKIEKEKYAMKTTIPVYYQRWKDKRKRFLRIKRYVPEYKDTYEFYYFGKNATTISNTEEFSIFRGTFRNLDHFINYSEIINDSINPAKTSSDSTDLTKRGIGSSYDIFSTQVEANRGYNILNMDSEYQTYIDEKRHKELEEKCKRYRFGIKFFGCRERYYRPKGTCITGSTEEDDIVDCETFPDFGNRVRGGATPLNLDMEAYQKQIYRFTGEYNYKNAIKPIFDIAGSVKLEKAEPKATSFEGAKEYISPIKISNAGGNLLNTDEHTPYTDAWYFNLSPSLINQENFKKNSNYQFTIKKEKKSNTDEELTYIYNIIPSEIKHVSTKDVEINGYSGYKYGTGTESYSYYNSIMTTLKISEDDGYSDSLNTTMGETKVEIFNFNAKVEATPNYTTGSNTGEILSGINALNPELLDVIIEIGKISEGQIENWRKFNAIFGNNYGAAIESFIGGFQQHQIQLYSKIEIRSKRYNEILSKITEVAKELERKRGVAEAIFKNYNSIFENIETLSGTIEKKIEEVQEIIDQLKDENETLSGNNANLENESENLENSNEQLANENANLNNSNTNLSNEIARLQADIANLNTKKGNLASEKSTLETQKTTLEEEFAPLEADYNALTTEKNTLTTEKNTLTTEKSNLATQNTNLRKENTILTNKNTTLDREIARLTALNSTGYYDAEIAKKQNEKATNETTITNNETTIANNETRLGEINTRIPEIETRLGEIETDLAPIEAIKSRIDKAEKRIKEINNEISQIESEIISKNNEISRKQGQITSNNTAIENNNSEVQGNLDQIEENNNQIEENNNKIEENERLIEEAETVKAAWIALQEKLPQLEDKVENGFNILEKCTANHSVLGNIIDADKETIRYGQESDECEEDQEGGEEGEEIDDIITVLIKELNNARIAFQESFTPDPENPQVKIRGMNILTQDRPIDSPRYISFQGIGEHVIKIIYPDIFKVEIYKSSGDNITLKKTTPEDAKNEIYKALQSYFRNKVNEYNTILEREYNNAKTMNTYYKYIGMVDMLGTPTKDKSIRPYGKFTYDEMIKAIGGKEMLYTLAELLYYQSVSNKTREYFDNVGEDIDETKKTFDINKKIGYVMDEYLKEENDKFYRGEEVKGKKTKGERKTYAGLVLPTYSTGGYEVGYINSNGADNITPETDDIETALKGGTTATNSITADEISELGYESSTIDDEASQDIKKDCGFDINEALSLYDGSWFKGLACWLEAVAKKPLTVKVYFQTTPTISSITEPLEQTRESYKQSFSSTIEGYEDMPVSSEEIDTRTQKIVTNTQVSWNDNKVSVTGKTGSINFISFEDLGDIIVKVQSTGDNYLIINGKSTYGTPVTINQNPYKKGFSLNYKLGKNTIGKVMTTVSLCSSSDNCYVKKMALSVVPGPVSKFKIETSTENKVLAGAYTLIKIKALDSLGNEISRTLENYYVKVDKGNLYMNGEAKIAQEINDFKESSMLYRANKGTAGTVNITVEDRKGNEMGRNTINIFPGELKILYNNSETTELKYTISNEKYYNDDGSLNNKKVIPLKIALKNGGQTVKITSNVMFGTTKGLSKIMIAEETKDNQNNNKIKLREVNSLLIEDGEADVFLIPGYKAGEDEITVTVPGLEEKKVKLKIEPGEMKNIGINLEENSIYPTESIKGEIQLTDARGNKIIKNDTITVSTTTENKVLPNDNPTIVNGSRKFVLKTTEDDAGLHKISVKSSDGKIHASKSFTVKNFFLNSAIESGLNIMYLNLFGNDRGNQRGYYSDNTKFSENIIQKSGKTLAVTTQLIAPSKIKETNIIFGKKGNIQNNGYLGLKAALEDKELKIKIDSIGQLDIKDKIEKIAAITNNPSNEQIEKQIDKEEGNVMYLFNINEDYKYKAGVFYNGNGEAFAEMKNGVILEWSDFYLGKYPVWDATCNGQLLGNVIIANIDYSSVEGKIENIDYEIGEIFDKGSTSSKVKALQSNVNKLNNSYQGYDSIQNSDELNKYIGFRADFKNITLFAEGESVGESTIPYGSEFLINIGDPLLKNRDEVASKRGLGQVKFSEPTNSIFKVIDIDYNGDGLRDLITVYRDGSINLLKQYQNKKFQDLGKLMISSEQINEVFVGDVDGNKYEDIIIKNGKDQLRVYTNDDGVFDVDGNIVCLNTNTGNGTINKNPEDFSGVIQLFVEDMDGDGRTDIVTLDKKGYLKIMYGNGTKSRHSYMSKDVYSCDKNWHERQEGATKIIKKFGIQLSTKGVADESILRRDDLTYPDNDDLEKQVIDGSLDKTQNKTELEEQGIYIDPDYLKKLESGEIDKSEIKTIVELSSQIDTTEQAQKASEASSVYIKNPFVGQYMDRLNDENLAFISMYNVEKYNSLTNTKKINKPTKLYKDKNGGELEDGDEIEVTVTITTNGVKISEFFDKISGPRIVDRDPSTGAPKDLEFIRGTGTIIQGTEGYDYGIVNGNGSSGIAGGNALQFKYTLKYNLETSIYRIKIVKDNVIKTKTVSKAEEEDKTILRRNGLKYDEKNKDILIKNPFGTQLNINDGLNIGEQGYININDIGEYINRTSSKEVYIMEKNYKDLNGGDLDDGDTIEVTVRIPLPSSHGHINAIFEDIKGPWNESGIPGYFKITKGNCTIKNGINGYDFYVTNINPAKEGEEYIFEYKYHLTYKEEQTKDSDNLPSIIVQPIDGCVKMMEVLENAKTNKNRAYNSEIVDLQKLANKYAEGIQAANDAANEEINKQIYNADEIGTDDSVILNSIKEKYTIKDVLENVRDKVLDENGLDFGNIDLDITKVLGTDLKKIEGNLEEFANGLCNGFTFGTKGGSKTCEGLPVPFNQAFLAPGNYHIMGCIPLEPLTNTLGNGLPTFTFPGTLRVTTPTGPIPLPIPNTFANKEGGDQYLRMYSPMPTPYFSAIRIYASPTLTAQLGITICAGQQFAGLSIPSPVSDIGGNCIVTAVALPCGSGDGDGGDEDDDNEGNEEEYEDWISEYGQTNTCSPKASESPFTMVSTSTLNSSSYPTSPSEGPYLGGLVSIDYDTIGGSSLGNSDSGIEINGVQIKGAKDLNNKLLGGIQQGIQKILINWIDNQIQYWINNLLRFEIEFTFPDLSYLAEEINNIGGSKVDNMTTENNEGNKEDIEKAKDVAKKNKSSKENIDETVEKTKANRIGKKDLNNLDLAGGANPFKELQELFNESDLVHIGTQQIPIRIPWIYSEDIEAYKSYLLVRYDDNSTILKGWTAAVEAAVAQCKKEDKTDPKKASHCKAIDEAQKKIQNISNKFDKIGPQIMENVQTLEAYKRFPLEIYEWLHVTDKYLGDISALIGNFFGYINYWMEVNANRFTQYCDAIITIVTIVKTYQIMIDLFVDWGAKCGKCTQDTYDQYSCKLSFLCSAFEIPVIPIPSVKIPSLYIDLSSLNLQMNILLPRFTFRPEGVELPRLPNFPQPPELGVNFNIDFDVPDIPKIPQPPELPELPNFIPQVKMELPILPPAPKIPEIPNKITGLLKVAKTLSKIFCIIKSGIGLVGEKSVKARIEQMTQRSYEVPRVDNLDLTMFFKQTPLQGMDIEVDSYVNLQYNFDAFYSLLKSIVDPINDATYSLLETAQNGTEYLNDQSEFSEKLNEATNRNVLINTEISKTNTPEKMKEQLYELRDSLVNIQDIKRVDEVLAYASTNTKVEKNEKGFKEIENELNKLIKSEKENVNSLAELAKNNYDTFLKTIENKKEEPLQLTFATNLLNTNEKAEKVISKSNAKEMLIETENKKVEGYYSALKNHTAKELNMTEETYNNSIKYMASIKDKINQWNSIKRTEYAGTTKLIDNEGNTISKTLLTQTNNNTPNINEASASDYSQYVKGIFIKDGDKTINAVNSEYNYEKFIGYYEKDLDDDGKNELVMRDNNNLYIKYFEKGKNTKGKKASVIKPTLKEGSTKKYISAGGLFGDSIKVYDENAEVKNFTLNGQSFDSISFSWDNNEYEATSGYLMRIVERVDGFREKNSKNFTKYILFLPNGTEEEIDKFRIEINGKPQKIKDLIGKTIYEIKYYNPSQEVLRFSLPEVPRKREYIQITTIRLNESGKRYEQNAPRSNQLVGGRQAIADAEPPRATVELLRTKKNDEVADEGFDLEGYVGTYYKLKITWEDPTKVRVTKLIEEDKDNNTGKLLNEKDFDKFNGVVILPNLFFTGNITKEYTLYAVDSQGNETEEKVTIDITAPGISIENIERIEGYREGIKNPVIITSELETDIDKGDVSFERFRNNAITPLTSTEGGGSKQTYPVTTNQTTVAGQYYDYGDEIGLYSKDNKEIGNLNGENGEIIIKPEYEGKVSARVDLSQGFPVVKLIEGNNPLFEIVIQPQELIKTEVYQGSLLKLEGNNYGMFNGGNVIMKDKKPLLYIATDGTIYTTENLQGDYTFNKSDETITYTIYETFGEKIASITFKAKPLE